jgi:hypothetical protein
MEFTREMLQQAYEDATGIDGRQGQSRIDWYAGKQDGNTICLGYTSGRGSFVYKNAIFAQSDEIFAGE